ncbi:MAG: hypothetical protein LBO21_04345 [Synergistaceae bacterium]|jgi:hypothetical protein|nr:hypothetical protein [Synergistaceae bacterium]
MARSSGLNQSGALIMLGVSTVALMFFISWSFRADNMIAGSFRLEDIQICEELDEDMKPLSAGKSVNEGTKQVCLWFSYSSAREGDSLEINWRFENQTIQRDVFRIANIEGVRAFYLLMEDGSPLPTGSYSVELYCNGRKKAGEPFWINPSSGDVDPEQYEFLD